MTIRAIVVLVLAAAVAARKSPTSEPLAEAAGVAKSPEGAAPKLGDPVGGGNFLVSSFRSGPARAFANSHFASANQREPLLASLKEGERSTSSRRGTSSRSRPAGPSASDGSFVTNGAGIPSSVIRTGQQRTRLGQNAGGFGGFAGQTGFSQGAFPTGAGGFASAQRLGGQAFRDQQGFPVGQQGVFPTGASGLGVAGGFPAGVNQQFVGADPFGQQAFAPQQQQFISGRQGLQGQQQFLAAQQGFPQQFIRGQADPFAQQFAAQQGFPGQQFAQVDPFAAQQGLAGQQQFIGGAQQFPGLQAADPFAQQFAGQQGFAGQQFAGQQQGFTGQQFASQQGFAGQQAFLPQSTAGLAGRTAFDASASAPFANTAFPSGFSSLGLGTGQQRGTRTRTAARFQ